MISLPDLVKKTGDLPPLPEVVTRLLQMSRDPDVSLREMAKLIKIEPALTAKVLRLCNSAYYGLPRKVSSIDESLVYLGADTLVNFVLAGCISAFYRQAQDGYGLAAGELWRHSVACAIAAQQIGETTGDDDTMLAFTAGLLHDVGKIVINAEVRAQFDIIFGRVQESGITFEEAEREVLGFTHCEVGAEIARTWNLPETLIEAIEFHQNPLRAKDFPQLVAEVHVANILCISLGIGLGNEGMAYAFHPKALDILGLQLADLYPLTLEVHEEFAKAEELVGLVAN